LEKVPFLKGAFSLYMQPKLFVWYKTAFKGEKIFKRKIISKKDKGI
jgi:hypothetical protein